MNSKTTLLCFFLLCFSCLWQLCPTFAVPTHEAEPGPQVSAPTPDVNKLQWRRLASTEGQFSILMPSSYTSETHVLKLSFGKEVLQQYICRVNDATYVVEYVDRPQKIIQLLGPEELLSITDKTVLKANRASLVSERNITLEGYPGHEIAVKQNNSRERFQHTFLVGNRLYKLIVVQAFAPAEAYPTNAGEFLDSFMLLPAVPNTKR